MLSAGMSEAQILEIASQVSPQLRANVEGMIWWLYHRHQEYSIIEHLVSHVEEALDQAGVSPRREARPPAIVFLDLAGYTRLTEERGDDAAAELAASLAGLVQRESQRRGGRPVKWLGDGVMFHFPDPGQAVLCSLDLVEEAPAAGMPPGAYRGERRASRVPGRRLLRADSERRVAHRGTGGSGRGAGESGDRGLVLRGRGSLRPCGARGAEGRDPTHPGIPGGASAVAPDLTLELTELVAPAPRDGPQPEPHPHPPSSG